MTRLGDPLYRNAFFLMLTYGSAGFLGFLFWLVVARFYGSDAVGLSVTLIALSGFLGSLSSLGLGIGLIHFLPSTLAGRNHRINTSLTLTSLSAIGVSLVFFGSLDLLVPNLTFIRDSWSYALAFLALTVGFVVIPLVDGSFLAARKASYVLRRSLLLNSLRLPIPIIVAASLGALGILFSFGLAILVALLVSFFWLMPHLYPGFRPVPSFRFSAMKDMLSYSVGNHIANLLLLLPNGILPLLILSELSASSSAHFYIAWVMASLLFLVPASSATSLFIEGSHPGTHFYADAIRSLRFGFFILIPAVFLIFFAGPSLLNLFGREYSTEGIGLLRILAISAFFVAINHTFFSYLRVNKELGELALLSSVLGVGTIVASYFLLDGFGLLAPGMAFLSIQVAISGYVLLRNSTKLKEAARELIHF